MYSSIPKIGGIILYVSFIICILFFANILDVSLFLIFSLFLVLFGILDDILNLSPFQKITGQVSIISFFIYMNYSFMFFFPYLFLYVLMLNASNLIDGSDGVLGSLSLFSFMLLFYLSGFDDKVLLIMIFLLIIVLLFNLPNAKIYFGEAGALFIGFVLTYYIIENSIDQNFLEVVFFALLVFPLPLIDVFLTIIRRIKMKQNIFKRDMKHIHHFLLSKSASKWITLIALIVLHMAISFLLIIVEKLGLVKFII
tara:strand:- start:1239 stop:2000 length:762 start_codon:yes stop_codon:yes gene_type:complete